jgi:hypothetical protein
MTQYVYVVGPLGFLAQLLHEAQRGHEAPDYLFILAGGQSEETLTTEKQWVDGSPTEFCLFDFAFDPLGCSGTRAHNYDHRAALVNLRFEDLRPPRTAFDVAVKPDFKAVRAQKLG